MPFRFLLASLVSIISFLSLSPILNAQSQIKETSKVVINTNYESFYVVVGDSIKNSVLKNSGELFDIESGERKIWVIPEYSNPYSVRESFLKDSLYVMNFAFRSILRTKSEIFSLIKKQDSTLKIAYSEPKNSNQVSYSFQVFTTLDYDRYEQQKPNYNNTYLKVISNVDSLYVNTNNNNNVKDTFYIASGDSILLPPGLRNITLSHQNSIEKKFQQYFQHSSTTTIKYDFKLVEQTVDILSDNIATKPRYKSNFIVVSDEDSDIIVNERHYSKGVISLDLKTGPVNVSIKNPYSGVSIFKGTVSNTLNEKAVVIDAYTKPRISTSRFFSVFPGGSQIYKQQKLKGYTILSSFLLSGYLALQKNKQYDEELKTFRTIYFEYNRAFDEQTAIELGNQLEQQHQVVKEKGNQRITLFAIMGAIYAFNLYDAIFTKPNGGYRTKTDIDFYLDNKVVDNNRYTTLSLRYDF